MSWRPLKDAENGPYCALSALRRRVNTVLAVRCIQLSPKPNKRPHIQPKLARIAKLYNSPRSSPSPPPSAVAHNGRRSSFARPKKTGRTRHIPIDSIEATMASASGALTSDEDEQDSPQGRAPSNDPRGKHPKSHRTRLRLASQSRMCSIFTPVSRL